MTSGLHLCGRTTWKHCLRAKWDNHNSRVDKCIPQYKLTPLTNIPEQENNHPLREVCSSAKTRITFDWPWIFDQLPTSQTKCASVPNHKLAGAYQRNHHAFDLPVATTKNLLKFFTQKQCWTYKGKAVVTGKHCYIHRRRVICHTYPSTLWLVFSKRERWMDTHENSTVSKP